MYDNFLKMDKIKEPMKKNRRSNSDDLCIEKKYERNNEVTQKNVFYPWKPLIKTKKSRKKVIIKRLINLKPKKTKTIITSK